jgi:hypothetical protein
MPAEYRKPGPAAVVHRAHRRAHAVVAPFPMASPQYLTGPRHGQQLALVRSLTDAWRGL